MGNTVYEHGHTNTALISPGLSFALAWMGRKVSDLSPDELTDYRLRSLDADRDVAQAITVTDGRVGWRCLECGFFRGGERYDSVVTEWRAHRDWHMQRGAERQSMFKAMVGR